MLGTVLLTSNRAAAEAIGILLEETKVYALVFQAATLSSAAEIVRACRTHDPHLVLVDCGEPEQACFIARQIRHVEGLRAAIVGFLPQWTPADQRSFELAGISHLLKEPFGWEELDPAACAAIHQRHAVDARKLLAFLPAKAGGGSSTAALHTAGALANELDKKVVVVEADLRSGVLGVLLDLSRRSGLLQVLERVGELTAVEWERFVTRAEGLDLLLVDPSRRTLLPTWGDYYQLLCFLETQYDYMLVDLPEVINPATVEIVRSAGHVFVVSTPELPSIKLARQRCEELENGGVSPDQVHVLVNRWATGGLTLDRVQQLIGREVYATLPNDYSSIQSGIAKSKLASPASAFAKGCLRLARKAAGMPRDTEWFRLPFLRSG
jgi:pilus assembly protein CpaE